MCLILAVLNDRTKRDRIITELPMCNLASTHSITTCQRKRKIDKLQAICKFVAAQTCVFLSTCKITPTGWNCPGVHRYHVLHCCDYRCNA